jgi:hypothetical protein
MSTYKFEITESILIKYIMLNGGYNLRKYAAKGYASEKKMGNSCFRQL